MVFIFYFIHFRKREKGGREKGGREEGKRKREERRGEKRKHQLVVPLVEAFIG